MSTQFENVQTGKTCNYEKIRGFYSPFVLSEILKCVSPLSFCMIADGRQYAPTGVFYHASWPPWVKSLLANSAKALEKVAFEGNPSSPSKPQMCLNVLALKPFPEVARRVHVIDGFCHKRPGDCSAVCLWGSH